MKPLVTRVVELEGAEQAFWRSLVHEESKPPPELWVCGAELASLEAAVCAFLFIGRGIVGKS